MTALPTDTSTAPIPSGTITFVVTDIEGSTQRWDLDRATMTAHPGSPRGSRAGRDALHRRQYVYQTASW